MTHHHDDCAESSGLSPGGSLPEGPRVLLVEDDADTRALFSSHLRRLGCSVIGVGTGEEALRTARLERPDIAIIDLRLPGMTGEHVMTALRADPSTANCRIVITSVLDSDSYPPSADAVLPKPFTRRQLEELVTTLNVKNSE
ncbi:response regulator [Flexivirga alba]|uniref:Response regulator n=1 Tax=Flexivirga alba TaxID=702742 RepID=A0ABW2ADQ4_9MICO